MQPQAAQSPLTHKVCELPQAVRNQKEKRVSILEGESRRTLSGGQVTEDAVLCRGLGCPPVFPPTIPLKDEEPENILEDIK